MGSLSSTDGPRIVLWTLLNLLRIDRRTLRIPVILCTAAVRHMREIEDHLHALGIRVVFKPFDIDHLIAEVKRALGTEEAPASHAGTPAE